MKKTAAIILNRNLPELADELGEWILDNFSDLADLYVLENGSDSDKYSKFANIILKESLGPAGGVNEALKQAMERGYDYFWVNYNDARLKNENFIREAVKQIEKDPRIGVFFPYWGSNTRLSKKFNKDLDLVSFSDIISFVVSRKALELLNSYNGLPNVKLTPFWDGTNFPAHYNILATSLALYENDMCMVTDKRFEVYEKAEPANQNSEEARGFSGETWKYEVGPKYVEMWMKKAFPNILSPHKEARNIVIERIIRIIKSKF